MISTSPITVKHFLQVVKNDTKRIAKKVKLINSNDKDYCYDTLNKVSRSFAIVIQDLPSELKDAVCVFYLVLRALDTIEDDMKIQESDKESLLMNFHEYCDDESFSLDNVGDKPEYVELMRNYPIIARFLSSVDTKYQLIVKDTTKEMAIGMLHFAKQEVYSKNDYNEYCHYVAGIVGQGLSKLFAKSGLESQEFYTEMDLANEMGLFLQKTNIIRDYQEDVEEGRIFWPRDVWGNYVSNYADLKKNPENLRSIACLNTMVIDAMNHFESCLTFLSKIENEKIYRFCAIPQLMALATLVKLYNNANTLKENVKIDRATTMEIFAKLNNKQVFSAYSIQFLNEINIKECDVNMLVLKEKLLRTLKN